HQIDFSNKICNDEDIFLTETTNPDELSGQQNNPKGEFDSYLLLAK
ncbi:20495_t:CDS:1, partial [Gigaspora rosea]